MLDILKANNIKPTWEIVLYANSLLILNCVKPSIVPINKENKQLINKLNVQLKEELVPKKLLLV